MGDPSEDGVGSVVTASVGQYNEVAIAITSVVVTATELSPLKLPPFSDIGVDPETLDILLCPFYGLSRRSPFQYAGYFVSLFGGGALTVHPLDE